MSILLLSILCINALSATNISIVIGSESITDDNIIIMVELANNTNADIRLPGFISTEEVFYSPKWELIIHKNGERLYLLQPFMKTGVIPDLIIPRLSSLAFTISMSFSSLMNANWERVSLDGSFELQLICKPKKKNNAIKSNSIYFTVKPGESPSLTGIIIGDADQSS